MKTAVSIPDELFVSADQLAQRRGMSRDELYTTALYHYIQYYRDDDITEQLNEIYGTESGHLDPVVVEIQTRSLIEDPP